MFCEPYRQPLTDAANRGEALPRELAAHLDACHACGSAFAQEQVLFSAIDSSLRAIAKAQVPASFVPGVQAALSQNEVPRRQFKWLAGPIPVTAGICAVALILFFRQSTLVHLEPSRSVASKADSPLPSRYGNEPSTEFVGSMPVAKAPQRSVDVQHKSDLPVEVAIRVEPASRIAIDQLVQFTRQEPEVAESLAVDSGSASIVIKPIEVVAIGWEPIASETAPGDRNEPNN